MFWKKKKVSDDLVNHPEVVTDYVEVEYHELTKTPELPKSLLSSNIVPKNVRFPGQEFVTFENKNEYVKFLQQNLIQKGYSIPGGPDGTYGIATVKAVQKFYDDSGLGINDGKHIGPKAWNKLFGN
jgi:peptidoglycan hydrolase-like protein with peptidoglycan-binding domain